MGRIETEAPYIGTIPVFPNPDLPTPEARLAAANAAFARIGVMPKPTRILAQQPQEPTLSDPNPT